MKQHVATALASTEMQDAFTLAREELMVVVFAKTSSPYYKLAVNVASGASTYREHALDGSLVHLCAFGRTPEQAARADSLLAYTGAWASTQVFAGGRLLGGSVHSAKSTLRCYQDASECTDHRAHCHTLASDVLKPPPMTKGAGGLQINLSLYEGPAPNPPPAVPMTRYLMPCKRASHSRCLDDAHPASLVDQVQAVAVGAETAWCPLFDASKFRIIEPPLFDTVG